MKPLNWAAFPWKTAAGVLILLIQAGLFYRAGRVDEAVGSLGLALSVVGVSHNVLKGHAETKTVNAKVDDLSGKLNSLSSDSLPTYRPPAP
jgi:hypothetical protein